MSEDADGRASGGQRESVTASGLPPPMPAVAAYYVPTLRRQLGDVLLVGAALSPSTSTAALCIVRYCERRCKLPNKNPR